MTATEKMDRILIVNLKRIDGLLLLMPMIRELRYALPEARIDLLVPESQVSFARTAPYPNFLLPLPESFAGRVRFLRDAFFLRRRRRFYDVAFLAAPPEDLWFAKLLAKCIGSRKLCYYAQSESKERHDRSSVVLAPYDGHEVAAGLRMLAAFEIKSKDDSLPFWEKRTNRKNLAALSERLVDVPNGRRVLCCPRSDSSECNWPEIRFVNLFQRLRDECSATIILFGTSADVPAAERFRYAMDDSGIVSFCGSVKPEDYALLASLSTVYLGPDGPMVHFAAAARKPCVILSPHVNSFVEAKRVPWQVPYRILRPLKSLPPCDGICAANKPHCITGVRLEAVFEAVAERLS